MYDAENRIYDDGRSGVFDIRCTIRELRIFFKYKLIKNGKRSGFKIYRASLQAF